MVAELKRGGEASERLKELLNATGKWGDVQIQELADATNVSYGTAQKWLAENTIPRTVDERIRVSKILGIDIVYWEYGGVLPTKPYKNLLTDVAPTQILKFANAAMKSLQKFGYEMDVHVSSQELIEIGDLALEIAIKSGIVEPDDALMDRLVQLAARNKVSVREGTS